METLNTVERRYDKTSGDRHRYGDVLIQTNKAKSSVEKEKEEEKKGGI